MQRLVAGVAVSLVAAFALGDPAAPPPQHTVSWPSTITAPKREARDELQRDIDEFFRKRLRRLTPARSNADFAYLSFAVDDRGGVTARFGARGEKPSDFFDGCTSCELEEKLSRIVEKTLFKHARLYTAVSLRDCSATELHDQVTITVAPGSAGAFEPKFYYRARLVNKLSDSDVTLSPPDDNEIDDVSARFNIDGTAQNEFISDCAPEHLGAWVLVPYASNPADTRSTNPNATSASRRAP